MKELFVFLDVLGTLVTVSFGLSFGWFGAKSVIKSFESKGDKK